MPSVVEILSLPALSLSAVTTPDPDAAARWVTTSELADPSPFLEGGEILLTTGLVERTPEEWRRFVEQLLDAGVVALGFGVGLSHPEVPTPLTDAATELSLNLFIVPRPVPFIAVSRAVADLLWAAEREADRQSLQHQRELTSAAIGGPRELLATLARTIAGSAVLCSPEGSLIAGEAEPGLVDRALPHIQRLSGSSTRAASSDIVLGSRVSVHPVGVTARAEAFLVVESESPAATHRVAVTTALALLTLDRERAQAELDADRRIRAGALSLALRSDTEAALLLLAGSPHSAVLSAQRARVVRARGVPGALERALPRIERAHAELGFPLVAIIGEQLVAVVSPIDDHLESMLRITGPLETGIGPVRFLSSLAQSDDGARQALAAASAVRPVVNWGELVETGVDSLLDPAALASFTTDVLGAVLERPDSSELLGALRAFLTHNGHVGPAAESLDVHRNTLRNRLTTVEMLLARSLRDPQLRADLWVALKATPARHHD
ncbi:MAG: PucR family transcriptional regulator [Cryobacterium sp.]|nr:PucR family transcriptional regulator [Cryobacterium sp.]